MPDGFFLLVLSIFGLVFGSFISALSYRAIFGLSIMHGRSICPKCRNKINFYDNLPLISYIILKGKCRKCKNRISLRYPLTEFFTMLTFLLTGFVYLYCQSENNPLCIWKNLLYFWSIPFLLINSIFLISAFVTDFETKIIPDRFVLIPYVISLLFLIFVNPDHTYVNIFLSFAVSTFFFLIHLITRGKGMGLGDVKFVLFPPLILGWPHTISWLFLSFIIGSVVGVIMIIAGKTKFGKQIPFGPFLILSYFIVLFWGEKLLFLFILP